MITLEEIKKKAIRAYPLFLKSTLLGESFFPYTLRSDKSLSNDFVQMSKEISELMSGSKDRTAYGYKVQSRLVKTRSHGIQDIPELISFQEQDDYLRFIGKSTEFNAFLKNVKVIRDLMPSLNEWMIENSLEVVYNDGKWNDLLKVCSWFVNDFEPTKYYIRELPISVHTKFIEESKAVLSRLLDHLIPERIDNQENEFEKRYQLKYVQPLVRFRWLTPGSADEFGNDISVPLDKFITTPQPCRMIFIIENKLNFLTFPPIADSIALWGKGFAIECLKDAYWLAQKDLFYWSDLDVQGFQMLSQLRSYFPRTKAFLMDQKFLDMFQAFVVEGTPAPNIIVSNLNETESAVFNRLKKDNLRLEQERIPHIIVLDELKRIV
jgi:hypothetical protein